jgi:uncharacterized protein
MIQVLNSIYEKIILARPVVTLFFLSLILVGFSMGLSDFKIDASTDALLLESDKDLRSFREMGMRYKTKEFMFIAVAPRKDILSKENIDLVTRLRDDLAAVPNVLDVISMLDVPLVTNKPGTLAQAATNFPDAKAGHC